MSKFEELLEKYNKTLEDIDFEYETMSDEELESKFAELFDDADDDTDDTDSEEQDEAVDEDIAPLPEDDDDDEGDETDPSEEEEEVGADDTLKKLDNEKFSVIKGYELSHDDIRYAIYNLLSSYEEADNEWYFVENVYDNHFVYSNWAGDKVYGQNYIKDGDNVSFDGERFSLHRELLTDAEYVELQNMRSNYASLVEFKQTVENNELHAKREEVLSNEKYSAISETEAFIKLKENMDNYSLEELEKEAKIIFADNYEVLEFSKTNTTNNVKVFGKITGKKASRYGNLFNK